jgi:hypothetical protein
LEYLKLRLDEKTATLNALAFALIMAFSSGRSVFALTELPNPILE